MSQNRISVEDARALITSDVKISAEARRAVRWFRWFVVAQTFFALSFTISLDLLHVPYWNAFVPMALGTASIWMVAYLQRRSAPRYGLRNMGIAVATWFALYTLMLDPALQLVGATSSWWWALVGIVAASPILACLFASSRG